MPRPRKYDNDAERQAAYRTRKRNVLPLRNLPVTRPALRWLGGKWRVAEWIIATFPPHVCYVEPFGGAMNVLLQKPLSALEVYNDLDREVVGFFKVLRSRTNDLIRAIQLTPFCRDELEEAFEPTDDPLEAARRFYVRCWQAFSPGSGYDANPSWRAQSDWARGKSVTDEWNQIEHLTAIVERIKRVQIENRPAEEVIRRFDTPKTLFYVDPPYVATSRTMGTQSKYRHEMGEAEHRRLAELLRSVQGMVILSGYQSTLYADLYKDWQRISKSTTTNGNNQATEYLWLSPSAAHLNHLPLFAGA